MGAFLPQSGLGAVTQHGDGVNTHNVMCSSADEKVDGARQAYEATLSSGLNFFDTAGEGLLPWKSDCGFDPLNLAALILIAAQQTSSCVPSAVAVGIS
jgi:hypothetical protein